jgi:hypothetical protein
MPPPLPRFRSYDIAETPEATPLELWRHDREIVCLASLPESQQWVELHIIPEIDAHDPSQQPTIEAFHTRVQALTTTPNRRVLKIIESGEDEGSLFCVTEYVDGEPLDTYLARCAPLPAWWAVEIARQLTLGLLAVRPSPDLLIHVQLGRSQLTLEGEGTEDALLKLAGFDLAAAPTPPPTPAAAETHAIQEVGRVLSWALTGSLPSQLTPGLLTSLPVPAEVTRVFSRVLEKPSRRPAPDLAGLLTALTVSSLHSDMATAPARLPPTLRPRLPLASHFATLPQLASELGDRVRLEKSPFDASQPYAQRGFAGTTPVMVQLLPPARLLPPTHLPLLRAAAACQRSPHLLHVREISAQDDPTWFLEDGPPALSLYRVRHLRSALTATEAAHLLYAYDEAVQAITTLGLHPVALCPQQAFIHFPSSPPPGDDELATQPVHFWPAFKIQLRAHPITTQFSQPQRFLRERLLDPIPLPTAIATATATASLPPGMGIPNAADYAALLTWLCGGPRAVPAALAPLVHSILSGSSDQTTSSFLQALSPLLDTPLPSAPAPLSPQKTKPRRPPSTPKPARPASSSRKKSIRTEPEPEPEPEPASGGHEFASGVPAASTVADERPGAGEMMLAAPVADGPARPGAELGFLWPDLHHDLENDEAELETESGGFAEVLLGSASRPGFLTEASAIEPDAPSPTWRAEQEGPPDDEPPIGALFGGWTSDSQDDTGAVLEPPAGFDFSGPGGREQGPGVVRLMLLVVAVAFVIAAIMAHFTGLAPWR